MSQKRQFVRWAEPEVVGNAQKKKREETVIVPHAALPVDPVDDFEEAARRMFLGLKIATSLAPGPDVWPLLRAALALTRPWPAGVTWAIRTKHRDEVAAGKGWAEYLDRGGPIIWLAPPPLTSEHVSVLVKWNAIVQGLGRRVIMNSNIPVLALVASGDPDELACASMLRSCSREPVGFPRHDGLYYLWAIAPTNPQLWPGT